LPAPRLQAPRGATILMKPVESYHQPEDVGDFIPLREARQRVGVSDSTARRMIKRGTLRAETRDGLYGPELWVSSGDVEAQEKVWQARRPPTVRSPDSLTLGELIEWAQAPSMRVAFSQWTRTNSFTFTPLTVLRWIRERLGIEEG